MKRQSVVSLRPFSNPFTACAWGLSGKLSKFKLTASFLRPWWQSLDHPHCMDLLHYSVKAQPAPCGWTSESWCQTYCISPTSHSTAPTLFSLHYCNFHFRPIFHTCLLTIQMTLTTTSHLPLFPCVCVCVCHLVQHWQLTRSPTVWSVPRGLLASTFCFSVGYFGFICSVVQLQSLPFQMDILLHTV